MNVVCQYKTLVGCITFPSIHILATWVGFKCFVRRRLWRKLHYFFLLPMLIKPYEESDPLDILNHHILSPPFIILSKWMILIAQNLWVQLMVESTKSASHPWRSPPYKSVYRKSNQRMFHIAQNNVWLRSLFSTFGWRSEVLLRQNTFLG